MQQLRGNPMLVVMWGAIFFAWVCQAQLIATQTFDFSSLSGVGPVSVPAGYGAIANVQIRYMDNADVYDFGGYQALTHLGFFVQNDTISISTTSTYVLSLNSYNVMAFGSRQTVLWHWVTCDGTVQPQSLNAWSSTPRTIVPNACSGQSVSLNFGTSWDLGITQISYSIYGVNNCQVNNGGCGPNGVCLYVSAAQITCSCNQGYMDVGGFCADINECSLSNYGGCTHPPAGLCVNSDGGHNCVCQSGFRPTPASPQLNATCVDINECETFPPVCGSPSQGTCYDFGNTTSGYNCTCNFGFAGPITGPCTPDTTCGGCGANSVCNQITHVCDCVAGYQPLSADPHAGCGDINECLIGSMGCYPGTCDNKPGGWSCSCPSGYSLIAINATAATCSDINECTTFPCGSPSNATCSNTPGNYNCTCNPGFAQANPNAPCLLIDYCASGTHCGNGTCHSKAPLPFWDCQCNSGYDPDPNNSDNCLDINECATNPNECGLDGFCTNLIGSHFCSFNGSSALGGGGGGASVDARTIGIGFGYGLAALLGCIALIFLILCLRKRHARHQYIQRRLKHAAAIEGVELTMRNNGNNKKDEETNEDILNAPLEGNFMNDDIMHGDTADDPHNGGRQEQDRDEMDTAHLKGQHQHSSSSEAVIPPATTGTNEGPSQFQGVPTPADAEFGEDAIGPDGEYVLVVTPRNGAGVMRTQSSILLQPKIRIIDDRSQEFKRAPIAAALSAASVLAVSASGALNTKTLPRITPQAQQQPQPQPKLAPQIQPHHQQPAARAATPPPREPTPPPADQTEEERPPSPLIPNELDWPEDTDGPIPVRPRKPLPELPARNGGGGGDVVNAIEGMPANASEEEAALNAAMAESLMVPEGSGGGGSGGLHSGEHSAQSTGRYSQQPSQQNSGQFQLQQEGLSPDEPQSPADNDQTEMAEDREIDYASDLDDQPVPMSEKAKKEAQKRKKHEFEAHLKHEKEEEARRRKQAKADEAKHKKDVKSHKVQDEIHVDPEKEAAIRNAFARFRQQDAAAKAVEEAALPVSDELMDQNNQFAPAHTSDAAADQDSTSLPQQQQHQHQQQDSEHSSPSTGPSEGMSRLQNIEPVDVETQQRSGSFHPAPAHPVDVAPAHAHKPVAVAARPAAMLEDSPKSARSDQHGVLYNQSPSEFDHRMVSRMEGEPRSAGVIQHSEPPSPAPVQQQHHQPAPAAVSAHSAVASHAQHHSFDFSGQHNQQQIPQTPPQLQQQQSYSARLPQSVLAAALNVKGPSHPAVPVAVIDSRQSVSSVSPGAGSVSRVGKESAHNTLNVRAAPGGPGGKKYSHSSSASDIMPPAVALALHRGSSHSKNGELPTPSGPPTLKRVPSEGVPSQRRSESSIVRSITLRDVLSGRNPRCLRAFSDFCKAERIADNLEFYKIIEEYRHQKAEAEQKSLNEEPELVAQDMAEKADEIFKLFLNPQKPRVNLPEDVGSRLASRSFKYHRTGQMDAVLLPADDGVGFAVAAFVPTVFDEAQEVAFKQMETDAWFRFMKTDRAREFDS